MSSYILLRNNKEAGPYSFDELLQIGFKPYDLIWVEGKSAMWRYPSEVPELKDYSEAEEEQPYDRFYKKQNIVTDSVQNQKSTAQKQVYVSMPDKQVKEVKTNSSLLKKTESPDNYITEPAPVASVKYEQPLEEIKEMYSKNLKYRNQKIAQRQIMVSQLKKTALFTCLVVLGVLIGFLINKKKNHSLTLVSNKESATVPVELPASNQVSLSKVEEKIPAEIIITNKEEYLIPTNDIGLLKEENIPQNQKKAASQPPSQPAGKEIKQQPKSPINIELITPRAETNSLTGARNKKTRGETVEEIPTSAKSDNDLSKLVTVNSNDYQRGAFGGIRNLELTLTNHSNYFLDNVTVELQYLKPSEHTLRSEKIIFTKIPAEGTLTIAVPPSNRGIKVQFKIIKIESKELNTDTANL